MSRQKNSLNQSQSLKQKLSHQNIQLFKMLELNILQFNESVQEELDTNPALDNVDDTEYEIINNPSENINEYDDDINSNEINDLDNSPEILSEFKVKEDTESIDYSYDEDEKDFVYKKGSNKISIKNTATGIKAFGIMQLLINNGFINKSNYSEFEMEGNFDFILKDLLKGC